MMSTNKQGCFSAQYVLVVLFLGITAVKSQWFVDDDGCRTPNRGVGSCIHVRQCKPMTDFIRANSPLSASSIQVLQGYQCGYEGREIKVCCPDGPIEIGRPRPTPPTGPTAPDVTRHQNLNLMPFECGLQSNKDRIIGGNKTSLFEFPWMTLLSYQTGNGPDFRCGGTIINEWYILTAAHCITNLSNLKLIGVRVGEYNTSSDTDCERELYGNEWCAPPVQDIRIAESIPHPRYNATSFSDDIGLIRVATRINIAVESVKPICLPTTTVVRNVNFEGTKLTVTGWGATETGRKSSTLLKVDIPVVTQTNCRKAYEKTAAIISSKQLCAGGQNASDSCGGDSGGPLQRSQAYNNDARFIQYGVVSFGPKFCGQIGFPGVYTRVDHYMDWILDNMRP